MTDEGSAPTPPDPTQTDEPSMPEVAHPEVEPLPPPESMLTDAEEISVSPPGKMESSASEISVPEPVSVESPEPQPVPPPKPLPDAAQTHSVPAASTAVPPPPVATSSQPKPSARERMLTVVRKRKAERLEKIVALARERGVITNDDVEMLLKVSNATTTRYLNALVLAGRLRRFGARKHEKYEVV